MVGIAPARERSVTVTAKPSSGTGAGRSRLWLRVLVCLVGAVGVGVALRGRLPDPGAVVAVFRAADPRWAALAVLVQFLSQAAFALQQRRLLSALAVDVPARDMLAITYSRSAISMVVPAGAAVSAAFALRQFRRRGASTVTATAAMLLSGVASAAGLVLLYAVTVGAAALPRLWEGHAAAIVFSAAGVTLVTLAACVAVRSHRRPPALRSRAAYQVRWPLLERITEQVRRAGREARAVRARDWAVSLAFAVVNWLLDLTCLIAVAHACDLPLTWFQLATVYLAVQVVRQLPVTPGGIGLIEASLLAGLLAAGAPQASAAAVVLGYRLVSFWLVLPAGLTAYLRLTRGSRGTARNGPPTDR